MIQTTNGTPLFKIVVIADTSHLEGLDFPETEASAQATKCEFYQIEDQQEKLCQDES